jgi:hypothetical protein
MHTVSRCLNPENISIKNYFSINIIIFIHICTRTFTFTLTVLTKFSTVQLFYTFAVIGITQVFSHGRLNIY